MELLVATKPAQVVVLHGQAGDIEAFASELSAATRVPRDKMTINLIGASVGPHVGPGAYGAVTMSA